ncbi:protein kinase [Candidatus Margulisiibacteriota bacterium]
MSFYKTINVLNKTLPFQENVIEVSQVSPHKGKSTKKQSTLSLVQKKIKRWKNKGWIDTNLPIKVDLKGRWNRYSITKKTKTGNKVIGVYSVLNGKNKNPDLEIIQLDKETNIFGTKEVRTVIIHGNTLIISPLLIKYYDSILGSKKKIEYTDSVWDLGISLSVLTGTIAGGSEGKLYKAGKDKKGKNTFVKINRENFSISGKESWKRAKNTIKGAEIQKLLSQKSNYFVKFSDLGFYIDEEGSINLILRMEKMDNDLSKLPPELLKKFYPEIVRQCLKGLEQLHKKFKLIHKDVKRRNILYKYNKKQGKLRIKFCDFGSIVPIKELHQLLNSDFQNSIIGGTEPNLAPELIKFFVDGKGINNIGKEIDIWSLGVALLELKKDADFQSLLHYSVSNFRQWALKMTNESKKTKETIKELVKDDPLLETMLQFDQNKRTWKNIKETLKRIQDAKLLSELKKGNF